MIKNGRKLLNPLANSNYINSTVPREIKISVHLLNKSPVSIVYSHSLKFPLCVSVWIYFCPYFNLKPPKKMHAAG